MSLTITAGPTAEWHLSSVGSLGVLLVTGAVNDVIEVVISASNSGTSGVSAITGVTDSAGNDYDPVTTVNRTAGSAAGDGTTLGVYSSRLTSALTAGTITVSFSPAVPQASIVTVRIQPSAGHFPELVAVGAGATGDATTMSITSSSITSGHTIFGAVAIETDDTFTPDSDIDGGTWSTHTSALADNGGDNLCQFVSCQWKTVTSTATKTYNVATGGGTRDYAINWFSVRETELILDRCEGHWKLDESSGTGVDSRGSNTLTQTGTVGSATGKIDGARDFSTSNYLSIASNASLSTGDISYTLACWAKFDDLSVLRPLMCKWDNGGNNEYELAYSTYLATLFLGVSSNGSDENYIAASTHGTPSTGTWLFVVAWHDADADTINIQVNDGTVDSTSYSGGSYAGSAPFGIGLKDGAAFIKAMDGLVDQARFWKRVLTSDERTQLYEEGASSGRSADQAVTLAGVASGTASTAAIAAAQSAYVGTVAGSTAAATGIAAVQAVSVFSITYSAAATVAVAQDQSAGVESVTGAATATAAIAVDQADIVESVTYDAAAVVTSAEHYTVSVECQASSTTSETSWQIGPVDADVGDNLLIFIGSDNEGASGTSPIGAITDPEGNAYSFLSGGTSTYGVPGDGGSIESHKAVITTALSGDMLTVAFDVATVHKVATVYRITPADGLTVIVAHRSSNTGEPITSVGPSSIDAGKTVFGAIVFESDAAATIDSDTTYGTWSADNGGLSDTGGPDDAIRLVTQYKKVTTTGNQTYNANTGDGRGQAGLMATAYAAHILVSEVTLGDVLVTQSATVEISAESAAEEDALSHFVETFVGIGQDQAANVDWLALSEAAAVSITGDQAANVDAFGHESAGTVSIGAEQAFGVDSTALATASANAIIADQSGAVASIVSEESMSAAIGVDQASDVESMLAETAMTGIVQAVREADQAVNLDSITFASEMANGIGVVSQTSGDSLQWDAVATNAVGVDAENTVSITSGAGATVAISGDQAANVERVTAEAAWAAVIAAIHGANLSVGYDSTVGQTPLVTLCIARHAVYVPGARVCNVYSPGTRSSDVYANGHSSDTIYSPGAVADTYAPGSSATQVGCHQ